MAGLARVRASVSQLARLLKDSRELTSYTRSAPAAMVTKHEDPKNEKTVLGVNWHLVNRSRPVSKVGTQ